MPIRKLTTAALAAAAIFSAPPALAHTRLEASSPQADSVVSPAPAQLRLQFSDPLELPFSKIKLVDDQGAVVAPSKIAVDPAHANVLVATMPALHPGAYRVQWSTVTRDGHKVKGEFGFRVK
ncbi:copper resistance protein CopC [Massilia sp. MS-15]|uniref:copper resistance protein CopC n=1 Tax=Massilia sp. MS-15 TaxID=2878200 RepID=UPI001CD7AA5A|nr:copper resistance protein CopC [Massilia sp. MS-15]MCA1247307.1 copper resistance protein CopC [Massilia sp. MS-15]